MKAREHSFQVREKIAGTSRKFVIGFVVVAAFAAGAIGTAATGWNTFASGMDEGEYAAYAHASGSVLKAQALAVQSTKAGSVSWSLNCSGATKTAAAGQIIPADVAHAAKCSLYGSVSTKGGGTVIFKLLRR